MHQTFVAICLSKSKLTVTIRWWRALAVNQHMQAEAHLVYDRPYFVAMYDDWLRHRAVWRRYATPAAMVMIVAGAAMSIQFRPQWLVGFVIAAIGLYELASSLTHRGRWINERISTVRDDKTVDLTFDDDSLISNSPNGSGTMRLAGFRGFATGTNGFFLIPDTGVSIYVPRTAISPADMYDDLVEQISDLVNRPPTLESAVETTG